MVVITDLAVSRGGLDPGDAAGLVGAAMLSVLAYPLAAARLSKPVDGPAA